LRGGENFGYTQTMKLSVLCISLFLVFTAVAETTHAHEESCDAPCPAVCLGTSCGTYCENTDASWAAPEELEKPSLAAFSADFVPLVFEDEIFHPPLV
jgi:hypothetical protein